MNIRMMSMMLLVLSMFTVTVVAMAVANDAEATENASMLRDVFIVIFSIEDALESGSQYLIYNADRHQYLFVAGDMFGNENRVSTHEAKFIGEPDNLFTLVGTPDNFTIYNDFRKQFVHITDIEDSQGRMLVLADVNKHKGSTLRSEAIDIDQLTYKWGYGAYTMSSTDTHAGGCPTDRAVRGHLGGTIGGDAWQIVKHISTQ